MENSHIFEDPSKLSVSQKVLSAVKPKYFCEKKSDELHSKCASTVHRLASKRTVNHVHTTLEKNFIALFVQGVPLIFPHHDIEEIKGSHFPYSTKKSYENTCTTIIVFFWLRPMRGVA